MTLNLVYQFTAFHGGGGPISGGVLANNEFDVTPGLHGYTERPLTATYKGGAAGRYATRTPHYEDGTLDPNSPGLHGRFTANAELNAYFGQHTSFARDDDDMDSEDRQNMVGGTIKGFRDDDSGTKLGFEVTLGMADIPVGVGGITNGMTDVKIDGTDFVGAGMWTGKFYGPAADTEAMESLDTELPSGVAGVFDAGSPHTRVVGAFAAEEQ